MTALTEAVKAEQAQRLTYPRHDWGTRALGLTTALAFGVGVSWLMGVLPALVITVALLVLSLYVAHQVLRVRRARQLHVFGSESSYVLGWKAPAWNRIMVKRWSHPLRVDAARIRLYYLPGMPMPSLTIGIITALAEKELGDTWKLKKHSQANCWIEIRRTTPESPEEAAENGTEKPEEIQRAESVTNDIFGEQAKATTSSDDTGMTEVVIDFPFSPRLSNASLRARVEKVVASSLPNRWRADWDLEHDRVTFHRRPDLPGVVPHPAPDPREGDARCTYRNFEIPYGIDEDGNVMTWCPRMNPHHVVAGTSGSGKTVMMIGMILEAAYAGWPVYICDAKFIEFLGLKEWPNVQLVSTSTEEQTRILHYAHELMDQRYKAIVSGRASEDEFEPMLFVMDEFADYREELTDWYAEIKIKGDPAKPPVLRRIRSVARKGRTARIHFLLGLQRPDAEFLSGEVRDNFSARTSLSRLSPQGAMMMWENAYTGVSLPRNAIGRGYTLNANGDPVEFKSYWTPDPRKTRKNTTDWEILEGLRPPEIDHERLMIDFPDPEELIEREFDQYTYGMISQAAIVPYDACRAADGGRSFLPDEDEPTESNAPVPQGTNSTVDEQPAPAAPEQTAGEVDLFKGYDDPKPVRASEIEPGDLVLVDESFDLWGVCEDISPDLMDEESTAIDYREYETGEPGALSIASDESLTIRRPEGGA